MLKKFLLLFLVLLLGSCAKLNLLLERGQETEPQAEQTSAKESDATPKKQQAKDFGATKSPAVKAKPSPAVQLSTVELVWQAPSDDVLRYHIFYGLEEDKLYNKTIVSVEELTRSIDPSLGAVYTYPLKGVPANKTVYFSIKAENQSGLSESSDVLKIVPEN